MPRPPSVSAAATNSTATPSAVSLGDDTCHSLTLADDDLAVEQPRLQSDSGHGSDVITTWDESQSVITDIHDNLIGRKHLFNTPFGAKAIAYADWTASGRALACIEDFVRDEVLPHYGNTHTTTSITGLQTTSFREEARQVIAQAVNAKISGKTAEDCVLFTGQGTTSAINKMVSALGLQLPLPTSDANDRPIVFVGPFEHHSNILPWRESCAEVVQVPENADGKLDVAFLVEQLQLYATRPLKIGSFSAASNLTGILSDVDHLSAVLHMHGALAFWDYASCAPYVEIDMNPIVRGPLRPYVYKDAIFFSGHKFVGGPNTPGVLVCKKRLLGNAVPTAPGGGTVFFVTKTDHRYSANKVEREEGGTPDIIGSIRLGLAFQVKQRVDAVHIMARETHHLETVRMSLARNADIVLLGRNALPKLPIFSFLVRLGTRFLHFNFVCALLNDLFGVQTRGGCQCAGPYATRILGITDELLFAFERAMVDKQLALRAGFSRISFPYFLSDHDVEYLLQALHFVATHGWKFLPFYRFNHKSGVWKHHTRFTKFPNRRWLADCATSSGSSSAAVSMQTLSDDELLAHQQTNLKQARQLAEEIMNGTVALPNAVGEIRDAHYDTLRWFVYPSEAAEAVRAGTKPTTTDKIAGPVQPQKYFAQDPALAFSTSHSLSAFAAQRVAWHEPEISVREEDSGDDDHENVASFVQSRQVSELEHRRSSLSFIGSEPHVLTNNSSTASISNSTSPRASVASSKRGSVSFGGTEILTDRSSTFQPRVNRSTSLPVTRPAARQARLTRSASAPVPSQPYDRVEDHKRPLRSAETALTDETTASHFDHARKSTEAIFKKINSARVFPTPPPALMKWVGLAVTHWDMIRDGDRLLIAVSGGKDSLGLLHVLLHFQKRSPVKFTIACATVDPETPAFDPSPLVGYIQSLGVPHYYLRENLIQRATKQLRGHSILSYTARMKRGALYSCCRKHKFNKLVLGHHLDDFAESFFMSAMHNGQLRTMRASYWNDKKDVQVVRPLVYAREQLLTQFAKDACLPVINENAPAGFEEPKERQRVKGMLSKEESLFPELFGSLRRALEPLMSEEPAANAVSPPCSSMLHESYVLSGSRSSGTQPHGERVEVQRASTAKTELRKRDKMREALRSLLRSIAA